MSEDLTEIIKTMTDASKLSGKVDGLVIAMEVVEHANKEYQENQSDDKHAQAVSKVVCKIAADLKEAAEKILLELRDGKPNLTIVK